MLWIANISNVVIWPMMFFRHKQEFSGANSAFGDTILTMPHSSCQVVCEHVFDDGSHVRPEIFPVAPYLNWFEKYHISKRQQNII